MSRATFFFKKLITLAVSVFLFYVASNYKIPFYISIAVLNLAFALISSRISDTSPKELYNFHRNEKYFAKGGMRDLFRIPVMLFSFLHDIIVWEIWGLYQIFEMLVDIVAVIKEAIYRVFFAIIWFLKLLVPFWRIVYRMSVFYLIKWPWWIFNYAYQNIWFAFRWNMLRIALPGAFLTLFVIQFFFFLDITIDNSSSGITLIGFILALLPLSWVFGEIASVRAQEMESSTYKEIKLKFRNGIETVRGILTYLAVFIVLLFLQALLNAMGWIPKAGFILLGIAININFVINIALIFLVCLIAIGTLVLPSYRLYNEFSETDIRNTANLISYIGKRIFQHISGLIPSSIFSTIAVVPITILVSLALLLTFIAKDEIIDANISRLKNKKDLEHIDKIRIPIQINELENAKMFPVYRVNKFSTLLLQEMKHRPFLESEIDNDNNSIQNINREFTQLENTLEKQVSSFDSVLLAESQKVEIKQNRIDDFKNKRARAQNKLASERLKKTAKIETLEIGLTYKTRKLKQLPVKFYLSGLFYVFAGSLIFTFLLAYWGNFSYNSFIFRNDGTKAEWRQFIDHEQRRDYKQPLLSTTLNIIIIGTAIILTRIYGLWSLLF